MYSWLIGWRSQNDEGNTEGYMSARRIGCVAMVAVVTMISAGCGQGGDETSARSLRPRSELSPAVAAQLDSGTTAYREDDFQRARRHYRRATELDPELASAWFGVMLAERALGNDSVADSLAARLEGVIEVDPHGQGTHLPGGDTATPGDEGFHGSGAGTR